MFRATRNRATTIHPKRPKKEEAVERTTSGGPGTSGGGSQQPTEQAKQQGQQLAQQARQQAGRLANRGGEQVKSQLGTQKHRASQRMVPVQSALRETAHQLRSQGQGPMAEYAEKASDQVERFSGYLRETDVDEIIDEVRGVARRRSALFVGGAAALGFLATRFLKSSSQEEGASAGYDYGATPSTATPYGTGGPPTALPPGPPEGEPITTERPPVAGQPLRERDRTEPPVGPTEPPRGY
jgi:hypothetical protein